MHTPEGYNEAMGGETQTRRACSTNQTDPRRLHVAHVRRVTWIGLFANMGLSALKFIVGILGNSQAVVADGVHSLSDSTTDLAILFGVRYWSAPADDTHPYGHWRIETLITVAIGIALGIVAIGLSINALSSLRTPADTQPGWIAFYGALCSIVVKEILFRWTLRVGRQAKSSAVTANAWHHRSDALSSIPAALAVVLAVIHPDLAFVDQIGAVIVSVFILHAAFRILRPAFGELVDSSAPESIRQKMENLITSHELVKSVQTIRTRRVGPGLHVDFVIEVDGELTVRKGHEICDSVTHRLLLSGMDIIDVVVHMEPFEPEKDESN